MTAGTITSRKVGTITADITIEEDHRDDIEITQHPVEQGASITDHAFKRPATLTLRLGWSNASEKAAGNDQYVRDVYAKLLALQASRTPFDIVTGKRSYTDMLIRSLGMTTDEATEYALFVTLGCQQIIMVSTTTTTVPVPAAPADSKKTGGVLDQGTKQPKPVAAVAAPPTPANGGF